MTFREPDHPKKTSWLEARSINLRQGLFVFPLLLFPVSTGIAAARRWPDVNTGFYATVSQIIATLFIAMAVEFFARNKSIWETRFDNFMFLTLVGGSWMGLFACVRGMLEKGTALTSGLAVAGLVSASLLVSLALIGQVDQSSSKRPTRVLLALLLPAMVLIIIL